MPFRCWQSLNGTIIGQNSRVLLITLICYPSNPPKTQHFLLNCRKICSTHMCFKCSKVVYIITKFVRLCILPRYVFHGLNCFLFPLSAVRISKQLKPSNGVRERPKAKRILLRKLNWTHQITHILFKMSMKLPNKPSKWN